MTHIDGVPVLERGCRDLVPEDVDVQRFAILCGETSLELAVGIEGLVQ